MNTQFGLKELTDLTLKATYPIEVSDRTFEPGEVIVRFDKIQIANIKELVSRVSANGGLGNVPHVVWEDTKEIQLSFNQGIFSKTQFALLSNSKLINKKSDGIIIPYHFKGESDKNGEIYVKHKNIQDVFVYNAKTFEKIIPKTVDNQLGKISINEVYCDVEIDYNFLYTNETTVVSIGDKLIKGYLCLEGKTRVTDDITGKTHTAILRIPRLKLVSDLSMRLGREATPMMASFEAIGVPESGRGSKKVMELLFLNEDIDAVE